MTYLDAEKLLSDEAVEAGAIALVHREAPARPFETQPPHVRDDVREKVRAVLVAAMASHPTPDSPESDEETWPAEFYITAVRTHGDGKVTGFEACEERDDAAQLRRNGHGPTRTYLPAQRPDGPASPVLGDEERERFLPASTVDEMEIEERRSDPEFRARLERSIEENRELLERRGFSFAAFLSDLKLALAETTSGGER